MINLKFLLIIIATFALMGLLANKQQVQAANCYSISGSINVSGPAGYVPNSVTVSCPGRPGLCPGDSQTVSSSKGYSLSGCNCLVSNGCVTASASGGNSCSIDYSGGSSFCYSNQVGSMSNVDINVKCSAPPRFDCVNPFISACQSDNGANTGQHADIGTCLANCVPSTPPPTIPPTPLSTIPPTPPPVGCGTCGAWYCDKPNTGACSAAGDPNDYQQAQMCKDAGCNVYYNTKCSVGSCAISGGGGTCSCNPANYACGTDLNSVPGCDPSGKKACSPGLACSPGQSCPGGIGSKCVGGGPVPPPPPPPPGPCLGNGAGGCNDGSGRACCGGLNCKGSNPGTCTNPVKSGTCKLPHSQLIYPVAPDTVSALNIPGPSLSFVAPPLDGPLRWTNDGNPGADCYWARDKLYVEVYIDGQLVQHTDAPGYGDGDTPNPGTNKYFPAGPTFNGAAPGTQYYANTADPSMPNGNGMYRLPFTPVATNPNGTPKIHTWYVVYKCGTGDCTDGGERKADNYLYGRFTVGPPQPNGPSKVCSSTSPSSGVPGDICNGVTLGPSSGTTLSVYNNGPDLPGKTEPQTLNVTLTNTTTGQSNTIPIFNTTFGTVHSLPFTSILPQQNGIYQWNVWTPGSTGNPIFDPNGPWTFTYDNQPPSTPNLSLNTSSACSTISCCSSADVTSGKLKATINTVDLPVGTSAGIGYVQLLVTNNTNSSFKLLPPISPGGPTNNFTTTYTFQPSDFSGGPNFDYTIRVKACDTVNNCTGFLSPQTFTYRNSCAPANINTQGGDVHSNKDIKIP